MPSTPGLVSGPPTYQPATPRPAVETGSELAEAPVTLIQPPAGWQWLNACELWHYRELAFFLGWRDVKVRYKQTILGAAWALLQPLLMMIVFTIFFSRMAGVSSGDVPYPLFAYAGVLPWTFFAAAVTNAANSVVGSERLITKIYFPRLAIPFAAVGAAVVDFAIALGLLTILMLAYGVLPGWGWLLVPVLLALLVLIAAGIGTLLAALNVAYRDFRYVVPFVLQIGMFTTPAIYMKLDGAAPSRFHGWLLLNPLNGLVTAFRAATLGGPMPWGELAAAAAAAVALMLAGCIYFRKIEDHFADVI